MMRTLEAIISSNVVPASVGNERGKKRKKELHFQSMLVNLEGVECSGLHVLREKRHE